ncbi:cytochrome P450 [Aspergillus aurantiobrunneus]
MALNMILRAVDTVDTPLLYITIIIATLFFSLTTSTPKLHSGFPTAGLDQTGRFNHIEKARKNWLKRSKEIVTEGLKAFPGCFQVITATGPKIVLPGEFADEIRNQPDLHFKKAISNEFFGTYPGFEPFAVDDAHQIGVEVVRGRLTQSLNLITEDLAQETASAIKTLCGQPQEWTPIQYKPMLLHLVVQVSTRIFIGPSLSTNKAWLDVSVNYATQSFLAAEALRRWHPALRPLVHWVLPECRELRSQLARAREILAPVVQKRRAEIFPSASKVADTIGWIDEAARGRDYDVVVLQLGLSLAAIHTTSNLVSGIITDLGAHLEWVGPLRQEMQDMLGEHGWTKKALQEMRLTDSMMKVSQRWHLGDVVSMQCITTKPVTLSDGTTIPKDASIVVSLAKMTTAKDYKPDRFLELRSQPGQMTK